MQRSSRKILTTHYACRNSDSNLTPVTGTTNGFIFFQIINSLMECFGVKLTWLGCKRWILYVLLFYLQYRPVQTNALATGAANIGSLNFSCLFQRAEIQMPVNKYECPQRLSFSLGNLFWDSFTNNNKKFICVMAFTLQPIRGCSNIPGNRTRLSSAIPTFPEGGRRLYAG